MQFLIQWTVAPERRDEIQGRFLETGAPPPEGVEMLGRWHRASGGGGMCIAQSDEIDNISILIERAFDARAHAVVVPMNPFADVTGERDEMRR